MREHNQIYREENAADLRSSSVSYFPASGIEGMMDDVRILQTTDEVALYIIEKVSRSSNEYVNRIFSQVSLELSGWVVWRRYLGLNKGQCMKSLV